MDHGFKMHPDGTLEITLPQGTKVKRVIVHEAGTQNGSLYYPESDVPDINDGNISSLQRHENDLISRRAAIDELKRISFSRWFECGEYLTEDTREIEIIISSKALAAIDALPSAEPKLEQITPSDQGESDKLGVKSGKTCTDCIKHGGDWECDRTHCRKGFKQQAIKANNLVNRQAAIDALENIKEVAK